MLIAGVLLSALVGRGWSGSYAFAAYAVGGILVALGLLLLGMGALQLRTALTPFPAPRAGQGLTTTGAFALVRHPMYGGGILIALGWSIVFATVAGLVLTVALAVFADLKARREEVWLTESFDEYEAYRERTPRKLIPFVY
jgi:protein-S-isoprenylcysteine O-methyltransferase Ste14